jgi:hypothetical protein
MRHHVAFRFAWYVFVRFAITAGVIGAIAGFVALLVFTPTVVVAWTAASIIGLIMLGAVLFRMWIAFEDHEEAVARRVANKLVQ